MLGGMFFACQVHCYVQMVDSSSVDIDGNSQAQWLKDGDDVLSKAIGCWSQGVLRYTWSFISVETYFLAANDRFQLVQDERPDKLAHSGAAVGAHRYVERAVILLYPDLINVKQ